VIDVPNRKTVTWGRFASIGALLACLLVVVAVVRATSSASLSAAATVGEAVLGEPVDFSSYLAPHDWYTEDRCYVYTYFDSVGINQLGQQATFDAWKDTWTSAGWKPMVLTRQHAERHPSFAELSAKFKSFPFTNDPEYEMACFYRHIAMTVVGGGYLADYDTVNVNVPPPPQCGYLPNGGGYTMHTKSNVPCLTTGVQGEFDRVVREMSAVDVNTVANTMPADTKINLSDMWALNYLQLNGRISNAPGVITMPLALSNPPCDTDGVELPMVLHVSHQAVMTSLNVGNSEAEERRGSYMREWQAKLLGEKPRCAVRGPAATDAEYSNLYFPISGATSAAGETLTAYRSSGCLVFDVDCSDDDATLRDKEVLLRCKDANGAPAVFENFH
jgi:hypothetical protein